MKRIGIVGGLGPEATAEYYRIINELYQRKTKGAYPEVIIYSVNMKDFPCAVTTDSTEKTVAWLAEAVQVLYRAGADFALIASNTPHIVFDDLQARSSIPMLSIVKATCQAARQSRLYKVALLGTKTTMSAGFYQKETKQGLLVIIKRMIAEESIQGVILGCTELPLILPKDEFSIPFLNTTRIHAASAVEYSLGKA
jgi:aspartate racemase